MCPCVPSHRHLGGQRALPCILFLHIFHSRAWVTTPPTPQTYTPLSTESLGHLWLCGQTGKAFISVFVFLMRNSSFLIGQKFWLPRFSYCLAHLNACSFLTKLLVPGLWGQWSACRWPPGTAIPPLTILRHPCARIYWEKNAKDAYVFKSVFP